MAEFPGFRRSSTLATTLLKALEGQSNVLNQAWGNILKGKYGQQELMRDTAQFYQSQFDLLDSLLPNGQAAPPNVPSWLTLDATKNQTLSALSGRVETRPFQGSNVNLISTQLAAFSGPETRFEMSVTASDSTHLQVVITKLLYSATSNRKPLELDSDAAVAQAGGTSGPYVGLIYDQRAGANAPLAVVTLMI